jgi:hypothetical protein
VPGVVEASTARVSVEEFPEVMEAGVKEEVTPAGAPAAVSATVCVAPTVTAVVMVDDVDAPCTTLAEAGDALMEKSFAGGVDGANAAVPFGVPRPVGPS